MYSVHAPLGAEVHRSRPSTAPLFNSVCRSGEGQEETTRKDLQGNSFDGGNGTVSSLDGRLSLCLLQIDLCQKTRVPDGPLQQLMVKFNLQLFEFVMAQDELVA